MATEERQNQPSPQGQMGADDHAPHGQPQNQPVRNQHATSQNSPSVGTPIAQPSSVPASGQSSSARAEAAGSPFSMMRRMSDEMDRLFENMLSVTVPRGWGASPRQAPRPQVEVFERDGQIVVQADLPGMKREDLEVQLLGDTLLIEGERKQRHEGRSGGVYRSERSYGAFSRAVPLPDGINPESVQARFQDGVLEVTMPVPQAVNAGRRIEISP